MEGALSHGYFFEDLAIGMEASSIQTVTEDTIKAFAAVSGDYNPIHLDEAYAAATMFKRRIAHGMLSASFISALIATKLPGAGAIYISQTLNFRAPVFIGDEVTAHVRIRDLIVPKKRVLLECKCTVDGKTVVEGDGVGMVPSRP